MELFTNSYFKIFVWWVVGILMLAGIILSCDNTIDPLDEKTGIFAIYGALDLNEQINYIRVRDMNVPFTAEATRELDAEVTLENLQTGSIQVLESERQQYEDIFVHNFVVNEEIQPDTEYRLMTKRSDGLEVSITTLTPTRTGGKASPINQDCYTSIVVEFTPVNSGTISYSIGYDYLNLRRFRAEDVLSLDKNTSGNASFSFTPIDLVSQSFTGNRRLRCGDLDNEFFYVHFTHYSPGFFEKISSDSSDILQSSQRFGALYSEILEVPIDTSRVCPPDCSR